MDLRDIIIGLVWMTFGNLLFYIMYPIYGSLIDGFSTAVIGSFGLTSTITAIAWGAYLVFWAFGGIAMPLYLIITGAQKE
jgi:hypothetical protein